jgi:hypothetical protein
VPRRARTQRYSAGAAAAPAGAASRRCTCCAGDLPRAHPPKSPGLLWKVEGPAGSAKERPRTRGGGAGRQGQRLRRGSGRRPLQRGRGAGASAQGKGERGAKEWMMQVLGAGRRHGGLGMFSHGGGRWFSCCRRGACALAARPAPRRSLHTRALWGRGGAVRARALARAAAARCGAVGPGFRGRNEGPQTIGMAQQVGEGRPEARGASR